MLEVEENDVIDRNQFLNDFVNKPGLQGVELMLQMRLQQNAQSLSAARQALAEARQKLDGMIADELRVQGAQNEIVEMIMAMEMAKREDGDNGSES